MLIDNNGLRQLLPHAGRMCLLDGVSDWSSGTITCVSHSHRDPANPLRRHDGRLAALHAFEYAAQAAAVHGGLRARAAGRRLDAAYLAALKRGRLFVDYLDDIDAPLRVSAERRLSGSAGQIYDAAVRAPDGRTLARVRVIVLGAAAPGATARP